MQHIAIALLLVCFAASGVACSEESRQARLIERHRTAARDGDIEAAWFLAEMYLSGEEEMPRDYPAAVKWLRIAAEGGHIEAQYSLGTLYVSRVEGVPHDRAEAARWYRSAAEQGHTASQIWLARAYHHGARGLPQDYSKAAQWYRLAGAEELANAAAELANAAENAAGSSSAADAEVRRRWPGATVTPSGLRYVVEQAGEGDERPAADTSVEVHYEGRLLDGTVFDSSRERGTPAVFPVNRVIRGWQEALQDMRRGERRTLIVPPELGYGDRGVPQAGIPPDAYLIFDVELLRFPVDGSGGG